MLLPKFQNTSYNTKKTRNLMKQLRNNFSNLIDTIEDYLGEDNIREL